MYGEIVHRDSPLRRQVKNTIDAFRGEPNMDEGKPACVVQQRVKL